MGNLTVQFFADDILEAFEFYKKALNASQISLAKGSQDEPIHLVMDVMGNEIALAPRSPTEYTKIDSNRSIVVLGLRFDNEEDLMTAYNVLKEGGYADMLKSFPWSPLEGYLTDKYGVMWCIGL